MNIYYPEGPTSVGVGIFASLQPCENRSATEHKRSVKIVRFRNQLMVKISGHPILLHREYLHFLVVRYVGICT